MHKNRTRSMQRYHKVHEIDAQPVGRRVQDDLLPDLANMTLPQCDAERRRLLHEPPRPAHRHMKTARHDIESTALKQAVIELLGEDTWQQIIARKMELRQAMLAGASA